jgi:predicted nucleic acid-binding protein
MNPGQVTSAVVVDTCVVSFLFKEDTRAKLYWPLLEGNYLFLSFMTVAELEYWALARRWRIERRQRLSGYLRANFVIHDAMSWEYCRVWAEVTSQRSQKGRDIPCADAWIAAMAILLNIPLVTNNVKDFVDINGLTLLTAP